MIPKHIRDHQTARALGKHHFDQMRKAVDNPRSADFQSAVSQTSSLPTPDSPNRKSQIPTRKCDDCLPPGDRE